VWDRNWYKECKYLKAIAYISSAKRGSKSGKTIECIRERGLLQIV